MPLLDMRTQVVLIDFESVQPDSLEALDPEFFAVKVFLGANQKKVPFETVNALQRLGQRAEYIQISGTGPNALDFHIAFYIGQLSVALPEVFFHIVSKDTGFDPLIAHLKTKRIFSQRVSKISDIDLCIGVLAKTPKERVQAAEKKLGIMTSGRPRTVKTLTGTLHALFQKQLPDELIAEVIQGLQSKGIIRVDGTKVSYTLAD